MRRTRGGVRAAIVAVLLFTAGGALRAQPPSVDTVVDRMGAYIAGVQTRMATIVADEQYRQTLERRDPAVHAPVRHPDRRTRTLRSDYVLLHDAARDEWVGFRDTFEVDGTPVRDHDQRLQELVTSGALAAAARIASESARFNLGTDVIARTINVPTFALHLLQPSNRERFSFRKAGEETVGGTVAWRIEYHERSRPTLVKTPAGRDRPSYGAVWVDPAMGTVWRTMVAWKGDAGRSLGRVVVTYDRAPGIDTMVPMTMTEHYDPPGATLDGEATYANFRQFRTDARVVVP